MPTVSRPRRRRRTQKLAAGAALAVAALAPDAAAALITVGSTDDTVVADSQCTLREALLNANDDAATSPDCAAGTGTDDVIDFAGLTFPATITLGGTALEISDSVVIDGPGQTDLTIDANVLSRVFNISDNDPGLIDVTIQELTLTNGDDTSESSSDGGAVHTEENTTLTSVTISNSLTAVSGGGVGIVGVPPNAPTLTIQGSTITGNTANCCGGGVNVDYAFLEIADSFITGNDASFVGGGVGLYGAYGATITNTTISENEAFGAGGGLYFYGGTGIVSIENSTITGNTAGAVGAGISMSAGQASLMVSDTTISENIAGLASGGVYLAGVPVATFERVRVIGNTGPSYAGGLGLIASGVTITDSQISGNEGGAGGGVYAAAGTYLYLTNSTVAENTATLGNGGGITLFQSFADISLSTISGNTAAGNGGNLALYSAGLYADNTIVADGTAAAQPDLYIGGESLAQFNYSLIETPGSASFTGANNVTGVDPQLGPLQNNGGPTETMKPGNTLPNPVIDGGDPAFTPPPDFDQRGPGFPRVVGTAVDMGAVEVNPGVLSLSSDGYSVSEGDGTILITVNRTGGSDGVVRVNFTTADGTALAGADYSTTSGFVEWQDNDAAPKTFSVTILEDTIFEGSELFNVSLNTPTGGATLGTSAAGVTILDNDTAPTITIGDLTQVEGTTFSFTVSLSNPTTQTVTVDFGTTGVTATTGDDFDPNSGTVTFDPLETAQPIDVVSNQDAFDEAAETFNVVLSNPQNASFFNDDDTAVGTITDDDTAAADLDVSKEVEGTGPFTVGQNVTFTITVTNHGPDSATNIVVTDVLPAGMTFVSASAGCTGTTTITCDTADLADEESAEITLTVQLTQAGTFENTATADSDVFDASPATGSAFVNVNAAAVADAIPTLSEWMLMALASALAAIAMAKVKR